MICHALLYAVTALTELREARLDKMARNVKALAVIRSGVSDEWSFGITALRFGVPRVSPYLPLCLSFGRSKLK